MFQLILLLFFDVKYDLFYVHITQDPLNMSGVTT